LQIPETIGGFGDVLFFPIYHWFLSLIIFNAISLVEIGHFCLMMQSQYIEIINKMKKTVTKDGIAKMLYGR
jgi:hypothetical protein